MHLVPGTIGYKRALNVARQLTPCFMHEYKAGFHPEKKKKLRGGGEAATAVVVTCSYSVQCSLAATG